MSVELTKTQKQEILDKMGGGEWWGSDAQKRIEGIMKRLMWMGLEYKETFNVISDTIDIIRNEYGE